MLLTALAAFLAAGALGDSYYGNTPDDMIPYHRMHVKPYIQNFYAKAQLWNGPGRNLPEPNVKTVKLGVIAPRRGPLGHFGIQMMHGAEMAIADANAAGGYKGKRFELVEREDKATWGDSSNTMVGLIFKDQVWGVLGTIQSENSHVMMRVALKFPTPVINCGTTDQTLMEHRVPFILRTIPDDRQYSYATAWYLFKQKHYQRVALFRINNRDGRFAVKKLTDAARRLNHPWIVDQRFVDGDTDFSAQLQKIQDSNPDAVVVWGNPLETCLILKQMRARGMREPVIAWYRIVEPDFLKMAGKDAEGVVCPYPYDPTRTDPKWRRFRARYTQRYGMEPDVFAAYAYDSMNIMTGAIRKVGLNRFRIADIFDTMPAYDGVTGKMVFNGARTNLAPIRMAEVRHGKFHFRPTGLPSMSAIDNAAPAEPMPENGSGDDSGGYR